MKKLISILCILLSTQCIGQKRICPDSGDATSQRLKKLNMLKNRNIVPQTVSNTVNLETILKDGNDTNRFNNNQYVEVTGYCILAKWGGAEGCCCHAQNHDLWDIHLVISQDSNNIDQNKCMIVEITRKYRDTHPNLKPGQFVGHKLTIDGYLFRDDEHIKNSVNDASEGTRDLFRKTPWEIHPVVLIQFIN